MYGRIYCVTNLINDKQYVGQTITKHSRHGHGHAMKRAYKKHGFYSFEYACLTEGELSEMQMDCFEKFWIAVLATKAPQGYNLEDGGRRGKIVHHKSNLGKKASLETRKKMSEQQKRHWANVEVHPNTGKKASAESRAKMSESHKNQVQSDATKLKRSESIKAWHKHRKEQACLLA